MVFFRTLFHLCGYFFLFRFVDSSKEYKPDSKVIFDIPTAVAFFGADPTETKAIISEKVRSLVKAWNKTYESKINVRILYLFLILSSPPPFIFSYVYSIKFCSQQLTIFVFLESFNIFSHFSAYRNSTIARPFPKKLSFRAL